MDGNDLYRLLKELLEKEDYCLIPPRQWNK